MNKTNLNFLVVSVVLLTSIACLMFPERTIAPGSLEDQIAQGDIRFKGTGNVNNPNIGCQDPTAAVSVYIGPKEKNDTANPVTVNAITDGVMVKSQECEKTGQGDQYDWPAKGFYHPEDGTIVFTTCTQNNDRAEGRASLVGDGFEGEYACYDDGGDLIYEVAFSAYEIGK